MQPLLIDTSVLSDWLLGNLDEWLSELKALSPETPLSLFISTVSAGEIEFGLETAPEAKVDRDEMRKRLYDPDLITLLDIDRHVARTAGFLRAQLFRRYAPRKRKGRLTKKYVESLKEPTTGLELGIQEADLWIVATAVTHDLPFASRDVAGGMKRIVDVAEYHSRVHWIPTDESSRR